MHTLKNNYQYATVHRLYINAANVPSPSVVRKTPLHQAPSCPLSLKCLSRPS